LDGYRCCAVNIYFKSCLVCGVLVFVRGFLFKGGKNSVSGLDGCRQGNAKTARCVGGGNKIDDAVFICCSFFKGGNFCACFFLVCACFCFRRCVICYWVKINPCAVNGLAV
jgi:hypothetical protein